MKTSRGESERERRRGSEKSVQTKAKLYGEKQGETQKWREAGESRALRDERMRTGTWGGVRERCKQRKREERR